MSGTGYNVRAGGGRYLEESQGESERRQRLEGKATSLVDSILSDVLPGCAQADRGALSAFTTLLHRCRPFAPQ
jgi:hypothetical protein